MMDFSVVIAGSGPSSVIAAYELASQTNLKVCVLERVKRLHDTREVANGFMGGSSRSDIKLFLTPGFGGEIKNRYLFPDVIEIFEQFSKKRIKVSNDKLPNKMLEQIKSNEIEVDEPVVATIASDTMGMIEKNFYNYLLKKVNFKSSCELEGVVKVPGGYSLQTNTGTITTKYLILGLGRGGAGWIKDCGLGLKYKQDSYDLGLRLEFPFATFKEYSQHSTNFRMRFGDYRTTAVSEHGIVELENVNEIKTSNGRTIGGKTTGYTNFGIIKTIKDKDPLTKMLNLVQIVNILADGQLLKEPVSRLLNGTSILCNLPEFLGLQEGIKKVLAAFPAIKSRCNYYAPEARLNALRFETSDHFESSQPNLYICGDASGATKSFVQAAASGLLAARNIIFKEIGLDRL